MCSIVKVGGTYSSLIASPIWDAAQGRIGWAGPLLPMGVLSLLGFSCVSDGALSVYWFFSVFHFLFVFFMVFRLVFFYNLYCNTKNFEI
jgi:hypothetical protein